MTKHYYENLCNCNILTYWERLFLSHKHSHVYCTMKISFCGCITSNSPEAAVKGISTPEQLRNPPSSTRLLLGPTKIPLDNNKIEICLAPCRVISNNDPRKKKVRFHIDELDEENMTLKSSRRRDSTCIEGNRNVKGCRRTSVTCKEGDTKKKTKRANQKHASHMKYSSALYFLWINVFRSSRYSTTSCPKILQPFQFWLCRSKLTVS